MRHPKHAMDQRHYHYIPRLFHRSQDAASDRDLIAAQTKACLGAGGKIEKIPTGYGATTGDVYIDGRLKNPTPVKDKKVQLFALSKNK